MVNEKANNIYNDILFDNSNEWITNMGTSVQKLQRQCAEWIKNITLSYGILKKTKLMSKIAAWSEVKTRIGNDLDS